MQVSQVSKEDGIQLAHILNALKAARYDNVGESDMEKLIVAKKWLHSLAMEMAKQLSPAQKLAVPANASAASPTSGFKVKNMGPIGATATKIGNKKKK